MVSVYNVFCLKDVDVKDDIFSSPVHQLPFTRDSRPLLYTLLWITSRFKRGIVFITEITV